MAKKPAAPKTVLTPIRVKMLEKPVKTGDVITVLVEEDYPTRFNEAASIVKQAGELMDSMKPAMLPDAIDRIFEQNAERPMEPIASVAFQDEKGNVTRISFTGKYLDTTAKTVEGIFKDLKKKDGSPANVNDYMASTVEAEFDSTVFQDAEGKFDENRYRQIVDALDAVCLKLKAKNPLSTSVAVKPLRTFHARRWEDFDKETNVKLRRLLPNQISFTPCPNANTGKMIGEEEEKT